MSDSMFETEGVFQRAPGTPRLPTTPFRFICFFVARYRWWYLAMIVCETASATCGILIPTAFPRSYGRSQRLEVTRHSPRWYALR